MQLQHLKTGELIDVSRTTFVIPDSTGHKQFYGTIIRDIQEQKKAELDLKSSRARLAAAQELAQLGSWQLELATNQRQWSREVYLLHGCDPDLPPPTFENFLLTIHPQDRPTIIRAGSENFELDSPIAQEYRTNPERGPIRHLRATIKVLRDDQGKPTHWLGTTQDITVLRSSEARLRRLIDSNAQGVYFWDKEGQIIRSNDAFLDLLGFTHEDLEAGRLNWRTLTPSGYEDLDMRILGELLERGFSTPSEKEYVKKDGTRVPVLIGAANFRG